MKEREIKASLDILGQWIDRGELRGKEIYVFGMGVPGDRVIYYLEQQGYKVSGVLDNNPQNVGRKLLGVTIYSPDYVQSRNVDDIMVLTYSKWHEDMKRQLVALGMAQEQVRCLLGDRQLPAKDTSFDAALDNLYRDWKIYEQYRSKYGEKTLFVLVPISLGDVYICCTLLEGLKRKRGRDVLLIVHGQTGEKVAGMFDIEHVISASEENMRALIKVAQVFGRKLTNIYAVPVSFHYSIIDSILGYRGYNCMDLFKHAMELPPETPIAEPISQKKGPGHFTEKDIIFIPYANSLPCLLQDFWMGLAERLNSAGYHVYTNSCDDRMEPVIIGTEKVFLSIDEMLSAVNSCGGVIGIRCGLCDVISTSRCKKVILYPNKGVRYGTLKDYFSLKEMGLCSDVTEIVLDEGKEAERIEEIVHVFA